MLDKISQEALVSLFKTIEDPYLKRDYIDLKLAKISFEATNANIALKLGYPLDEEQKNILIARIQQTLQPFLDKQSLKLDLKLSTKIQAHVVQKELKPLKNIKNIIAVGSGKGGVGKSTVALHLALALQAEGARVGLLDADIYGPSQPQMLGVHTQPHVNEQKEFIPIEAFGLQTMSIGYMVGDESPVIWRGPMVSGALQQLLFQTSWEDLDYLIVDLPPGTGDIQLTLAQKIPVSGALVVTTPQDIALLDARKALRMFRKVGITVLGIIENMSTHLCSHCGHEEALFGTGGGTSMAAEEVVPLLGKMPLVNHLATALDRGKPLLITEPLHPISLLYRDMARNLAAQLSLQARDYTASFPTIKVTES